jgi:CRP-like cAMP-binding protein
MDAALRHGRRGVARGGLCNTGRSLSPPAAIVLGFLRSAPDSRLDELKRLALFSELSGRELHIVQGVLHEREYLPGEVIFDEGEEGNALYIVRAGRVLICLQGQPESPVAEHGPGSFFGELALLDSVPRAAQARALEPSRLAVLFGSDFLALLESESHLGNRMLLQLARHLGRRLRGSITARGERVP